MRGRCHASSYPEHRLPHTIIASSKRLPFFLDLLSLSLRRLIKIHPEFSHETRGVHGETFQANRVRKKRELEVNNNRFNNNESPGNRFLSPFHRMIQNQRRV